ncbi:MAG: hypothetical protein IPP47_14400 [Bryobacterales bacterium]|nr:hypothetical protein [Bryobacterales bacterium]
MSAGAGAERREEFQAGVLKDADGVGGIEIEQNVNIAIRSGLPAGDGSGDGGVLNSQSFELLAV